jgi:hypothetical protein
MPISSLGSAPCIITDGFALALPVSLLQLELGNQVMTAVQASAHQDGGCFCAAAVAAVRCLPAVNP